MRSRKRAGLTPGSMVALVTTALVVAGCFVAFSVMRSDGSGASLAPEEIIGAVNRALSAPTNTPAPVPTIKTTTVTIAPNAQAQAQATAEPVFKSLSLTVGGEIALQTDITDALKKTKDANYTPDALFSGIAGQVCSDLNIALLANVLYTSAKPGSDVNADPALLAPVKATGFTMLLPAHENALDLGIDGARATLSALRDAGFSYTGLYGDQALAGGMAMLTVNGLRVAVLQYVDAALFKSDIRASADFAYAVTAYSPERAAGDIASARANGANIVVVSMHWGKKDATSPTSAQTEIASHLIASGANVVLGAHPTAVQPAAYLTVTDAGGARKTGLVAYSMGSLLEESRDENAARSGMLLHIQMLYNVGTGETTFASVEYTPTYIWRQDFATGVQFRVVASDDPPPAAMSEKQIAVMANALQLITNVMKNSPATKRE